LAFFICGARSIYLGTATVKMCSFLWALNSFCSHKNFGASLKQIVVFSWCIYSQGLPTDQFYTVVVSLLKYLVLEARKFIATRIYQALFRPKSFRHFKF
jgi:hypothetical protein